MQASLIPHTFVNGPQFIPLKPAKAMCSMCTRISVFAHALVPVCLCLCT